MLAVAGRVKSIMAQLVLSRHEEFFRNDGRSDAGQMYPFLRGSWLPGRFLVVHVLWVFAAVGGLHRSCAKGLGSTYVFLAP